MIVLVLIWIACGVVGWKLGESKGRPLLGLVLGVLLGLLGLLIVTVIPSAAPRERHDPWVAPGTPAAAVAVGQVPVVRASDPCCRGGVSPLPDRGASVRAPAAARGGTGRVAA